MKSLFYTAVLLSVVSSSAFGKDLIDINTFPEWFQNDMQRELTISDSSTITIDALEVIGKVPGKATLAESGDGYWYYLIDIGTGSPLECYSFTSFDGPANSLYAVVEVGLSGVEELNKKTLSGQYNMAIDTGVINNTPFLSLDTLYILDGENKERVTGLIKGLSAETEQSLQVCMHNELGYRDSFYRVFESFVKLFQKSHPGSTFFEPVFRLSFNGIPIGFGYESHSVDQDGDIKTHTKTALLTPVDASNVSRTDGVDISWSTAEGALINASTHTIENSTLNSQFDLSQSEGKWQVAGEMQGKPVSAVLSHEGALLSDYGSYLVSLDLLDSEQGQVSQSMWVAEADPVTVTEVSFSKITDNEEANLKMDMGPFALQFLSDNKGILRKGSMAQGPVTLDIELISVVGEPVLP